MAIKMVTFKDMLQMTSRQTTRILGSAHSTSTVKYICHTSALLW